MAKNTPRKVNKCLRCDWTWFPRKKKQYVCPKCKSYKWNIDKNEKV